MVGRNTYYITESDHVGYILKNAECFKVNYLPHRFIRRESVQRAFFQLFERELRKSGAGYVIALVEGPVGTGKTTLVRLFENKFDGRSLEDGRTLRAIYINCGVARRFYAAVLEAVQQLIPQLPRRGLSIDELLGILVDQLKERNYHAVLLFDDFDYLQEVTEEKRRPTGYLSSLLHSLLRLSEHAGEPYLSLAFTAKDFTSLLRLLAGSIISTLTAARRFRLKPYTADELCDILRDRAEQGFFPGTWSDEIIRLVADIGEQEGGDARCAISILYYAAQIAESKGATEILPDHIREAAGSVLPSDLENAIYSMTRHEILVLLSIARLFDLKPDAAYITMGELEREYQATCEEFDERPRAHTQLWHIVRRLSALHVIHAVVSSHGQRGRTTNIRLALHKPSAARLREVLERELAEEMDNYA